MELIEHSAVINPSSALFVSTDKIKIDNIVLSKKDGNDVV
jgi:hypothetical protein